MYVRSTNQKTHLYKMIDCEMDMKLYTGVDCRQWMRIKTHLWLYCEKQGILIQLFWTVFAWIPLTKFLISLAALIVSYSYTSRKKMWSLLCFHRKSENEKHRLLQVLPSLRHIVNEILLFCSRKKKHFLLAFSDSRKWIREQRAP